MFDNARILFRYNSRVLLANSYWLLIVPLVASQLVVFWHMAIATLVTASTVAKTCELVIPILAAFLCAHVVAPEHRNRVDELTFARPVPFARTIVLRMLALYAIVAILAVVMLAVYDLGLKIDFQLTRVLLAGVPSTLFLSALSLAFATAWRSSAAGIAVALLYWVGDAWRGNVLNPLFSLYSYATALAASDGSEPPSEEWMLSKGVLLLLTVALAWFVAKTLQRPASPKRWRAALRTAIGTTLVVSVYLVSGACWQFQHAKRMAAEDPEHARDAYLETFAGYGAIPASHLFGRAFAEYVDYNPSLRGSKGVVAEAKKTTIPRLRDVAERHPESPWADEALFEVIRLSDVKPTDFEEGRKANRVTLEHCRLFLDRYPTSPFAPWVAGRMVAFARSLDDEETMMWAYERVMKVYAGTDASAEAAAEMRAHYVERGQIDKAIECARLAAEAASSDSKIEALVDFAGFLAKQGRRAEATEILKGLEEGVEKTLEEAGLKFLTLENASDENFQRRAEIIRMRSLIREQIRALEEPPPAQ